MLCAVKWLAPTLLLPLPCLEGGAGDDGAAPLCPGQLLSYAHRSALAVWLAWPFAAFHIPLPSLSAQVTNVDVGWALGYMLNLTNMIPSEAPPRVIGLQRSNWIAATVLLAIMLILIFCLLTVICCQKNSGYERL